MGHMAIICIVRCSSNQDDTRQFLVTTWPWGISFSQSFFLFMCLFLVLVHCLSLLLFPPSCSPFPLCRPWTHQWLPRALPVTCGIRKITQPCSQQGFILLWDLESWEGHSTRFLYLVFLGEPKDLKFYFLFLSLVGRSFRDLSRILNDVMCECLCVFVHVVLVIRVGSLWEIVSVLTKKQVE